MKLRLKASPEFKEQRQFRIERADGNKKGLPFRDQDVTSISNASTNSSNALPKKPV